MVGAFASKSLDEITSRSMVSWTILGYLHTWIEPPVSSNMPSRIDFSVAICFERMLAEEHDVGDNSDPEDIYLLL